jgi:hypothetical protein
MLPMSKPVLSEVDIVSYKPFYPITFYFYFGSYKFERFALFLFLNRFHVYHKHVIGFLDVKIKAE